VVNNSYSRVLAQRSIRKVLIVCEGAKTERYYFEAFGINKELIKVEVNGAGRSKDSLVKYAIELKNAAESRNDKYAEVWCVFDRDAYPIDPQDRHKFNSAIVLARTNQIKAAYSNDAFEIWYILHFEYFQNAWSRDEYMNKLTKLLGSEYKKNDKTMYKILKDKQETAIKNAERLFNSYQPHNSESDNPCTTVHRLVEYLNDYLEDEE